jgi:hypothetical protein
MQGPGPKYSHRTRIGNWQEEIVMQEAQAEQYKNRSSSGMYIYMIYVDILC